MEKENQRVRLSKTMLKSGLLRLLKEKPLQQITIYELCRESEINRTTFYKYYGSQTDLLQDIEADFFAELNENLQFILLQGPAALQAVLEYLYQKRDIFCTLARTLPAQTFAEHFKQIPAIDLILQNLFQTHNYSETEAKYMKTFIFQGTFAILSQWLGSDTPESIDEIAKALQMLRSKL